MNRAHARPRAAARAANGPQLPAAANRAHARPRAAARRPANGAQPPPAATSRPRPRRPASPPPQKRLTKVTPHYYALVVPGLEKIASAELTRAGASVTGVIAHVDKRDGLVLFDAPDLRRVLRCGTLEDVFQVLLDAATPPARSGPRQLALQLARPQFEAALSTHHSLRPRRYGRSFKVISRVAGRHPFEREDLERAFERAVGSMLPHWTATSAPAAVEAWVHVAGERTIAGLRLSGDELAQRTYKRAHLPASLKPTVARALVILSAPQPGDVVLDPMCGAGTIVRERADAGVARRILGGDSAADAIAASRINAGTQAALLRWDATRLPLAPASVDVVITNPPYGRQHEALPGIERLYARSLREAARVLRPGGRCVVLTGEPSVLLRSLPPSLRVRMKRRWLLRGLAVTAFVMTRA